MDVYTHWLKNRAFISNQNKGEFNRIFFLWPCLFLDAWGRVWNEDSYVQRPPLNIILASSKLCLSKPMVIPFCVIITVNFFLFAHVQLLFAHNHLQQEVSTVFLHVLWDTSGSVFILIAILFYVFLKILLHLLENVNSPWKTRLFEILALWIPHHLIYMQKCKC